MDIDFVLNKIVSNGDEAGILDTVDKIANIVIALFTVFFSIYIYYVTKKREDNKDSESRKRELFKTLILDQNLNRFYLFFDKLVLHSNELLTRPLTDPEKMIINELYLDELTSYRLNFYELLNAINDDLYNDIKNKSDDLIDELTNHLSNPNLNLNIPSVYQDNIIATISKFKTESIKILFNYK